MNKIFKNIDKLLETDLAKNSIKVIDNSGYTIGKIEPVAIESRMTPGTFRITPVSIKNENESIIFNNGRDKLKILVKDFEDYMSEYDHGPTFPIGGLGDGSIVFIDLESGRVRKRNRCFESGRTIYYHNTC